MHAGRLPVLLLPHLLVQLRPHLHRPPVGGVDGIGEHGREAALVQHVEGSGGGAAVPRMVSRTLRRARLRDSPMKLAASSSDLTKWAISAGPVPLTAVARSTSVSS